MTIPEERLEQLQALAAEAAGAGEWDRSRRYVRLARRIAERHRIPFPRGFERVTCDSCDVYQRPSVNARVRTRDGIVAITCDCGAHARYRY